MTMSKPRKRILLVEDEEGLVMTLSDRLNSEGYSVLHAGDGIKGEQMARDRAIDLIILDVMLPGKGGYDVCRDLRTQGVSTPLMMLTARGQVNERVVGLKLGADDYVIKPFDMLELLARIESLLRRPQAIADDSTSPDEYSFGANIIDFKKREVVRSGKRVDLSGREYDLLKYFIENRGMTLAREAILSAVWGYESMPTTRTIDTHITWLRQKLEDNPRHPAHFLTVHGIGYRFVG
jgi:DNA-binding response OmpR family regulator